MVAKTVPHNITCKIIFPLLSESPGVKLRTCINQRRGFSLEDCHSTPCGRYSLQFELR